MKKLILMCGVAVSAMGMASCSGTSADKQPETVADSLGYYLGKTQGANINQYVCNMTEEQKAETKFDKDAFLLGFKTALDADTANDSYLMGLSHGMQVMGMLMQMHQSGVDINRDILYSQFKAMLEADSVNQEAAMADQQIYMELMRKTQEQVMARKLAEQQKLYDENDAAGKKFIEEQKAADNTIQTTASGLSYKVVKQGEGKPVTEGKVDVIYTGTFIDGEQFDSSNGEAVAFDIDRVVPGFSEGLKMMAPGSKYILYIPAELAYGEGNARIAPGKTLVFDVEVVGASADNK